MSKVNTAGDLRTQSQYLVHKAYGQKLLSLKAQLTSHWHSGKSRTKALASEAKSHSSKCC